MENRMEIIKDKKRKKKKKKENWQKANLEGLLVGTIFSQLFSGGR